MSLTIIYDGTDPVCEMSSTGTVTAVNTFGGQGLVSRHTTSGNLSVFYTFDERGNVAQRTSSSGAVPSTDLYDAYGARTSTAAHLGNHFDPSQQHDRCNAAKFDSDKSAKDFSFALFFASGL